MSLNIQDYESQRENIIDLLRQIIADLESDDCQAQSLSLEILQQGLPSKDIINSAPSGERIFTIRYVHIPTNRDFNKRYAELQRKYNGLYVIPKLRGER